MSLELFQNPLEVKAWAKKCEGSLGLVPTMGALHEGHLSLVRKSIQDNNFTAVSIFVNPTQFNNANDLESYPQNIEADIELLKKEGVDCVFAPEGKDMYPDNYRFRVSENENSKVLCGSDRPGHFDGVLTVVLKLLNIFQAKSAYFGEKDFQQLKLIQDMSQALFLDTQIVACPTLRQEDGLALSSRNARLSSDAQKKAPEFNRILQSASSVDNAKVKLKEAGFNVIYVEELWQRRLGAIQLDEVRLIDNVSL